MGLTPEEKAALKAEKKAQKKLAAELLKRTLRKDALDREGALGEQTWKKLKEKWREIIVKAKMPEMKEDLITMEGCIERWLDAKNFQIGLLLDEIDEFHYQSNCISQCHVAALDRLFEIFIQRVTDIRKIYDAAVQKNKVEAEDEFNVINKMEGTTQENMNAMRHQIEVYRDADEDFMNCEMFLKVDDEKSKNIEKRETLRTTLEIKMEKRWSEITSVLMNYQQGTEQRRKHFGQLRAKDGTNSKQIFSQMKKTQKLFDQVQELRVKLERTYVPKETILRIENLREERDKFYYGFQYLRRLMGEENKVDETQLKDLICITNSVLEYLRYYEEKGEQILKLFAICRKFETEKEKVAAVGTSLRNRPLPSNLENEFAVTVHSNRDLEFKNDITATVKDYEVLDLFWKQVGRVNLSRMGLIRGLCVLEKENKRLKALMFTYMSHMTHAKRSLYN